MRPEKLLKHDRQLILKAYAFSKSILISGHFLHSNKCLLDRKFNTLTQLGHALVINLQFTMHQVQYDFLNYS